MPPLSPAATDPNQSAEQRRKQEDPDSFGQDQRRSRERIEKIQKQGKEQHSARAQASNKTAKEKAQADKQRAEEEAARQALEGKA